MISYKIQDGYNINKVWHIKIYNCHHWYMNQSIKGRMQHKRFVRVSKGFLKNVIDFVDRAKNTPFILTNINDHDFSRWLFKHGGDWTYKNIGENRVIFYDENEKQIAFAIYDNENSKRLTFIPANLI